MFLYADSKESRQMATSSTAAHSASAVDDTIIQCEDSDSPSCSGVCDPYMGVLDPVPYMGVWEPYMGVRLWAEVIPLCLFAPLQRRWWSRRIIDNY